MHCNQCGNEVGVNANFCSNCGYSMNDMENTGLELKGHKILLIPVITAVLAIFWITGFYAFQIKTYYDIDNLREKAETLGLRGKTDDALKIINKALIIKPNNVVLNNDKIMLLHGKNAEDYINRADNYIKKNDYKQAENEVQLAEREISNLNGALYDSLNKIIIKKKASVTVLMAKNQMNTSKNVDDLSVLLTEVEQYDTDVARETSAEIRRCIGNSSYDRANEYLKVKDFTAALDVVNEGLAYDMSNDKLSSFKDTISKQKENFEKKEKESMEQAMEAAAREDDLNRTAALSLVESSGEFNNSGDFIIKGRVKNIATKPVSMVKIFYGIFDSKGSSLSQNSTYVYPNYINPGETGDFENTEYGIPQGCYIKIAKMTWYLE